MCCHSKGEPASLHLGLPASALERLMRKFQEHEVASYGR